MEKILISACLLGEKVRYNGSDCRVDDTLLEKWQAEQRLVPICPEVAGGLSVPRSAAEIIGQGGGEILDGKGKVFTNEKQDVTSHFLKGASEALKMALKFHIKIAILKELSPSCGSHFVYDGHFSGIRIPGKGVTAALLERNGIRVFNEKQLKKAQEYLNKIERIK